MIALDAPFTRESFTNTAVLGMINLMPELDEMITVRQAQELAEERGQKMTRSAITRAINRGQDPDNTTGIPGCRKLDSATGAWLIPRKNFILWLESPRPTGPKTSN